MDGVNLLTDITRLYDACDAIRHAIEVESFTRVKFTSPTVLVSVTTVKRVFKSRCASTEPAGADLRAAKIYITPEPLVNSTSGSDISENL